MQNHPDHGGSDAIMQEINAEYETMFNLLKKQQNAATSAENFGAKWTTETPSEFIEICNKLIPLSGINIELCGSWLWISGDTFIHKDSLKSAGCRWSKSKKMWYWHHAENGSPFRRGHASIAEIRTKYGSERIATTSNRRLSAV